MLGKNKEENKSKVETIIGEGTRLKGEIYTKGSLRIEGEVEGKIKSEGDLYIGESGVVKDEIEARNVVIAGKVEGNITALHKVEILPSGKLIGDLQAKSLKIEEGAVFNGASKPLSKVAPLNESKKSKQEVAALKDS